MDISLIIAIIIASTGWTGFVFGVGMHWAKIGSLEKEYKRINDTLLLHENRLNSLEKIIIEIHGTLDEIRKEIKAIKEKAIRRGLE
jgi:hypothetical protein